MLISLLIWVMVREDMFGKTIRDNILKIRIPADIPYERLFDAVFDRYLVRVDLMGLETVQAGMLTELVYGVELKKDASAQLLLDELRQLNQNNKVLLITGSHEVDL